MTERSPRIAPLTPPYEPDVEARLERRMPKNSPVPPLSLFRTLARHERLADAMEGMSRFNLGKNGPAGPTLPLRDRELVIDRVCARCGCEYEWGVHVAFFADRAGIDAAEAEATTQVGPSPTWSDRDRTLIAVVDSLHDQSDVSDELWAAFRAEWSEEQILEILVLAGWYHSIAYVANTLRVPFEPWAARFPEAAIK
ncbi:MAG TPA: carboxymuconolactone decarboxylase family protein [Polyangiaceae bacterium]|jgi:alkylhydroperoxidase family enzyme|nr:carboxymuconolactone decarboxylase family protein [Polyangiaceae bacterium]